MEISEVRVKLVERSSERLRAFCSVTFDGDFVIRDLKVIDGVSGVFVAMPSRKLADRCPKCGSKNHLRARFCNECGQRLNENRAPKDADGRAKLHADIAHPINADCRERIQTAVVKAYEEELERAKSPDYKPISFDDFDDDYEERPEETKQAAPADEAPGAEESPRESEPAHRDRGRDRGRGRGGAQERSGAQNKRTDKSGKGAEAFGDYNELIADLKREAATRGDDRRGGYGQRERQKAAAQHVEPVASSDATDESTDESQSGFGAGIEGAGNDRRNQNHRSHRDHHERPRREGPRSQQSHGDRDKRQRESDRGENRNRREQQETPTAPEAEKPEAQQPESVPAKATEAPPQEEDDFGAGIL